MGLALKHLEPGERQCVHHHRVCQRDNEKPVELQDHVPATRALQGNCRERRQDRLRCLRPHPRVVEKVSQESAQRPELRRLSRLHHQSLGLDTDQ